jgi:mono/diheme cytochrome c family protein
MRYHIPAFHAPGIRCIRLACAAALCVLGARRATAQQAPATAADSAAATPSAITAGRTVFHGQGTCLICHGANLEGGVGPQLTAHEWKDAKGGSYAAILGVITKGVDGTAMVAHPGGISDDQARQAAAYVWAVSHGKAKA